MCMLSHTWTKNNGWLLKCMLVCNLCIRVLYVRASMYLCSACRCGVLMSNVRLCVVGVGV